MEFEVAPEPIDGYPVILANGPITEESLVALGSFVRRTCDDMDVKGTIIDCSGIEGALDPESLYRATPAYTLEVGQDIKVAYINRPAHWPAADDQFSRDLAYNRGGLLEMFDTPDDAVVWLQQE